jgi:hypothetical protein
MISQPKSASDLAVSRPMPELQPVIRATLPVRSLPCRTELAVDDESNF